MSEQQGAGLVQVVREIADKVRRYREQYRERGLGEANTKASLIEPILDALGWKLSEPEEVYREFRPTPKDNPVDYCLRLQRDTRLLIEAKALGEDMSDRRWIAQTLSYATMAGAKWCVLTDGDEYLIYNATEAVIADQKLFCRIRLSEGRDDEAAKVLGLISRGNVEKDVLDSLWKAHFVDRRVKGALRELVDTVDRKFISLIRKRATDLLPKEIAASLRRLSIRIEAPESPYEPSNTPKSTSALGIRKPVKLAQAGVALADLIAAGVLTAPLKLFRHYKGHDLQANLLPDGAVEFQGQRYDTCSAAGEAARESVTGRRQNTNGWTFWQYQDSDGKTFTLADARGRLGRPGRKPKEGREDNPERNVIRKRFWEGLLGRPKSKGTRHADLAPSEYHWLGAGSGVRGLSFNYLIRQGEGGVELYIDRGAGHAAENKRIFDWLHRRKGEIERACGRELSWQRLDDKQACRIAYAAAVGGWRTDESKWPAIQDTMIDEMTRLENALAPQLPALKAELGL